MHPVICSIGPFTIYSYGLMLVFAFMASSGLAALQARKQKIPPGVIFNFLFYLLFAGIIGARLFYIAEHLGYYLQEPREIIMLQRGGLSWFGGLIAAITVAVIYLKKKKLPLYKTLDLVAPFVALAQGIGRIGCLLNGCCFGQVSQYGLYFPVHHAVLIPTQIYSSLILILIFIILRFLQERPHKSGKIFFIYLLLYSLGRFFIEFWRADNPVILFGLTLFQLISIAIFSFSAVRLFLLKRSLN